MSAIFKHLSHFEKYTTIHGVARAVISFESHLHVNAYTAYNGLTLLHKHQGHASVSQAFHKIWRYFLNKYTLNILFQISYMNGKAWLLIIRVVSDSAIHILIYYFVLSISKQITSNQKFKWYDINVAEIQKLLSTTMTKQ